MLELEAEETIIPAELDDIPDLSRTTGKLPGKSITKPRETPKLPFEEVASDVFEFEGQQYILVVDYYSKFIEVDKLKDTRSRTVIETLKAQFGRHGIPATMRTGNAPQYSSKQFREFCKNHRIQHVTSPHTPHSNGEAAERAVQTVQRLWRKAPDKHLALLDYRTTPLESGGLSPAQLLMGRRPRKNLPTARQLLAPTADDPPKVKHLLPDHAKDIQKSHRKKAGKHRIDLKSGDEARMQPFPGSHTWTPAVVVQQHSAPRSFVASSGDKQYRRRTSQHLRHSTPVVNCSRHWTQKEPWTEPPDHAACEKLFPTPSEQPHSPPRHVSHAQARSGELYITRRGRTGKPPNRLTL